MHNNKKPRFRKETRHVNNMMKPYIPIFSISRITQ